MPESAPLPQLPPGTYSAAAPDLWVGRVDPDTGGDARRYHQLVKTIDMRGLETWNSPTRPWIAILGFKCDLGVVRNLGRPGAKHGPDRIRHQFANLAAPVHPFLLFDFGDILTKPEPTAGNLLHAQSILMQATRWIYANGGIPIVLGGGHEVAKGHATGAYAAFPHARVGHVNIDAHFDLRKDVDGPTSGTSFFELAAHRHAEGLPFDCLTLGIQPAANTQTLFHTAKTLGVQHLTADEITTDRLPPHWVHAIHRFAASLDAICLTLCMDVLDLAFAPGVSAPQVAGLHPRHVKALITTTIATGKVLGLDVAETSPEHDPLQATSRLAAHLVDHTIRILSTS